MFVYWILVEKTVPIQTMFLFVFWDASFQVSKKVIKKKLQVHFITFKI